jgi:hypothetical protein
MLAVFAAWAVHLSATGYIIGVLIFFEVWSMTQVYQLGTLNGIDRSGRFVALVPAAQGLGQSVGPFIAGLLLGWQWGYSQVLMAMIFSLPVASAATCTFTDACGLNAAWQTKNAPPGPPKPVRRVR